MPTAIRNAINNTPGALQQRRFQHYVAPTRPPTGTYDPGLDATESAANRGLQDFQADTSRQLERGSNDYNIATGQVGYQTANMLQDYGLQTANRQRMFGLQGQQQQAHANSAGVAGTSGFDEQAAAVRAANQGREQNLADIALARGQHGQQYQQGQLDIGFQRQGQDVGTALGRAVRENSFFGADTNAARLYQSQMYGLWSPPERPVNERTKGGLYWQNQPGGNVVLEGGRELTRQQFQALRARRGI